MSSFQLTKPSLIIMVRRTSRFPLLLVNEPLLLSIAVLVTTCTNAEYNFSLAIVLDGIKKILVWVLRFHIAF